MTERVLDRHAAHRLAIIRHAQELTGNVAKTCRYYGISRQVYYKWLRRYEEGGLEALRDRSSRPHVSPKATRVDVVGKIIYLRQTYHFGPHKRWKRYEKPEPGHRVQIDVKFIAPLRGSRRKYYQFTAIDDCTRLRVLRIYDRLNQKTAVQFLDYVLAKLPFRVERIQTDNGAEFQSAFHYHVLDRGIGHVYIRPATPRLNGKVERSHRIDAEEFYRMLDGVVIDDAGVFNERLREWEAFYNFNRPHGGLGGQTPYERLRQKTGSPV